MVVTALGAASWEDTVFGARPPPTRGLGPALPPGRASYLISLGLGCLICKMEMSTCPQKLGLRVNAQNALSTTSAGSSTKPKLWLLTSELLTSPWLLRPRTPTSPCSSGTTQEPGLGTYPLRSQLLQEDLTHPREQSNPKRTEGLWPQPQTQTLLPWTDLSLPG